MTLIELNRYFDLVSSLKTTQELLSNLYVAAQPGAQVLTGMPHASGVVDKIGDLASEIADLKTREEYIQTEIAAHKAEVETFVSSIDDSFLRTIFRLRFERGLSWKDVASIVGGRNTEENVRASCYRYLKRLGIDKDKKFYSQGRDKYSRR